MPKKRQTTLDGYEAFSEISDATITSVRRDMQREPREALRLFKELSSVNGDVSLAALAEARQASNDHNDVELAYIQGVTFVLRLLAKQGKVHKLHHLLFPEKEQATIKNTAQTAAKRP